MCSAHTSRVYRSAASAVVAAALIGSGGVVGPAAADPGRAADAAADAGPAATGTAVFAVHGNGNGHGHGMSQYGARGAAIAGLSTARILAFYYPGTTLSTLAPSKIRVRLSGAASNTTVFAGIRGLRVTGYGALPTWDYVRFRLSPYGSGLALAGRSAGTWKTLSTELPARADFTSYYGWVRILMADGSSTRFHGAVGALRSGSGEYTIDRVSLDNYTRGVVPREMPASWPSAAVGAQAVAARTYGRNAVESHTGSSYDICDTTSCQVYGGMAHYSSGGYLQWSDDPAAVAGNENQVLTYGGSTIFAQFSASNGGASLDGGQAYLVGRVDPYDNATSGDPYLNWADHASVSQVAGYYGLKSVSSISITRRTGYGQWGGWVLAATVNGTNWSGSAAHVSTTGSSLASALGLMTSFFRFDSTTPVLAATTLVPR